MGQKFNSNARMSWFEICESEDYRGCWVALDNVRYDPVTSQPLEAEVVDCDEDLGDLCARMRAADRTSCAIFHCEEEYSSPMTLRMPAHQSRAAHH